MNELIAWGHGLRERSAAPEGEESPDRRSGRERMRAAIHGRFGAQIALLQSPILRDRGAKIPLEVGPKQSLEKLKSVTHVPGRKCYPCIGTFTFANRNPG